MLDFIEVENNKKFFWKWDIILNEKIEYQGININVDNKNNIIIKPEDELLLESYIYNDDTRSGYTCCDIVKKIDYNEISFFKSINEFILFIISCFYEKFDKSLNKSVLNFIHPLNNNKIKTYMAKCKYTNLFLTKFVNINTLEKSSISKVPLSIYIYPELVFKSVYIINKCIYLDIIIKSSLIYKPIKSKSIHLYNKQEIKKGIMKLPKELIINIMNILSKNDDLDNLIFTSKYFFYMFISNYNILHEKWQLTSFNDNKFNTPEWKHQKIKAILNY